MSRRQPVSFTLPVPEELVSMEELMLRLRATFGNSYPALTDTSGIGKNYRPERGDLDDRRQPALYRSLSDDEFEKTTRALSILHWKAIGHSLVVHIHYGIKPGSPEATCRKVGIKPQDWCAYRDAALRMLENILTMDVDSVWMSIYHPITCKRVAEDALAD